MNRMQAMKEAPKGRPTVGVSFSGYKVGLYRVQQVEAREMLLSHGGISFPVGTRLMIEDFQRLAQGALVPELPATVVRNDVLGIVVQW